MMPIVAGYKDLCRILGIQSKNGKSDADRKKFYRMAKKYNFPIHYENKRLYMFKSDVDIISTKYLLGFPDIAWYMGIHRNTLSKWLKRFPKMPVDRKNATAYIPDLRLWYACLVFNRRKRGKSVIRLTMKKAPIIYDMHYVFKITEFLGFSHPERFKFYDSPESALLLRK